MNTLALSDEILLTIDNPATENKPVRSIHHPVY